MDLLRMRASLRLPLQDAGQQARNVTVRGNQGMPSTHRSRGVTKNQFFHHNLLADQFVQCRGRYQRRISRSEPSISFFRVLTVLPARQVADSANDQDRNTIDISDLRYRGAFHFV